MLTSAFDCPAFRLTETDFNVNGSFWTVMTMRPGAIGPGLAGSKVKVPAEPVVLVGKFLAVTVGQRTSAPLIGSPVF